MLKPLTTICLTTAAIVVIGAYLLAQGKTQLADAPPAPLRVAMQEPAAASQEKPSALPLANVGWIGVMLQDKNGSGARVAAVFPGGPAAAAGVRVGDVLPRIGGADVTSAQDAQRAIERMTPNHETNLSVQRGSRKMELKVIPGSLADFRRDYVHEMLRRDPRDPNYGLHHGISEADVQAELVRRLFDQHERLDRSMHEVLKELQELRQEVAALKTKR